ncbi:MAG: thymidylate kinase [Bacteroidales bacterium]|nr:thymidylate kinase [Bacteroidales bacterium]
MLIVLEGLDGAGKSTQVRRLREYLEGLSGGLEYIHFPRYDAPVYGALVGKFLRGGFGPIDAVHPQLVALLYAEDRRTAAPLIREALAAGKTVLLDRYVYSNIAYQCAKAASPQEAEDLRDWIFHTEYGDFSIPKPDLNLFLDVPLSFVKRSLDASREEDSGRDYLQGRRDIHEASLEFQRRVREIYLHQTALDPDFLRVDCASPEGEMLPPDSIFARLKTLVEARLKP